MMADIWRTIYSFLFLCLSAWVNLMPLSVVHEWLKDHNTTAPLSDIFHDVFTARIWGLDITEYLVMVSTMTAMLVVMFHKYRLIVARRIFFILGILYLYRSITIFVTILTVPSTTYYCSHKSNNLEPLIVFYRLVFLMPGTNQHHTFCGDYVISTTVMLVLSYQLVVEYSPRKLWPVHWVLWGSALLGVTSQLMAHGHYMLDVVLGYYLTTRVFWTYHSFLRLPHHGHYMIQREWWYWAFKYLERNPWGAEPVHGCPAESLQIC